jgi:hypothetical protein
MGARDLGKPETYDLELVRPFSILYSRKFGPVLELAAFAGSPGYNDPVLEPTYRNMTTSG